MVFWIEAVLQLLTLAMLELMLIVLDSMLATIPLAFGFEAILFGPMISASHSIHDPTLESGLELPELMPSCSSSRELIICEGVAVYEDV